MVSNSFTEFVNFILFMNRKFLATLIAAAVTAQNARSQETQTSNNDSSDGSAVPIVIIGCFILAGVVGVIICVACRDREPMPQRDLEMGKTETERDLVGGPQQTTE